MTAAALFDSLLRPRRRPSTVVEWSRDGGKWVVSALFRGAWTLIGVFDHAPDAFRAADRAGERLTEPGEDEEPQAD